MSGGRGGWFITNRATVTGPARVAIYDEIGSGGVRAGPMLASLGGAQDVELRINSEGGSVFEAVTIYTRLSELRQVSVIVDGVAASAASVVAMAASPGCLAMAPHSRMMIHEAHVTGPGGNAAELAAMSAVLDGLSDEIAEIYAKRAGSPVSYWRDRMRAETWFTAAQAVAAGLADTIARADPFEALGDAMNRLDWGGL